MTRSIPFICLFRKRAKEQHTAVQPLLLFGHLIFEIDLTLGFWNLTFYVVSKETYDSFWAQFFS